jgi:hypothetical protein
MTSEHPSPAFRPLLVAAVLLPLAAARAQHLRDAVVTCHVVAVGTVVGVQPRTEQVLHRLRLEPPLRGETPPLVTVVEPKGIVLHQQPRPGERRLCCLRRLPAEATSGLPAQLAPFFELSALEGSHPPVGPDAGADPYVRLAQLVLESEAGRAPAALAPDVLALALAEDSGARTEAVRMLIERPMLRSSLAPVQWSRLVARAVGETTDVPYKISLAELAAEQKLPGLVDALVVSVDAVGDERFLACLGRVARVLHGDAALDVLRPHLTRPQRPESRARLLRVLGETRTERALQALLRMRELDGADAAVEAALRAHGSVRARPAGG